MCARRSDPSANEGNENRVKSNIAKLNFNWRALLTKVGPWVMSIFLAMSVTFAGAEGAESSWWKNFLSGVQQIPLPDGRKLGLYCEGKGSPVVMLEAGLGGGGISSFRKVQSTIGRVTKTCAYDRAGYWNSTPAVGSRDAGIEADDLAALLKAARLTPPYVIAAHSYGGYIARLYAGRHTSELAGLVLIDPATEHQADRYISLRQGTKEQDSQVQYFKDCASDPRPKEFSEKCLRPLADDVPSDLAEWYTHGITPAFANALLREFVAMPTLSSQSLDAERKSLGDIPFILLSRDPTRLDPALPAAQGAAEEALWLKMHVETMDLSSDSQLRIVSNAGHNIQLERPGAVIAAVTEIVLKVRNKPLPLKDAMRRSRK
jgi:pimeloyl-ACP methyl ester carboxylesterase